MEDVGPFLEETTKDVQGVSMFEEIEPREQPWWQGKTRVVHGNAFRFSSDPIQLIQTRNEPVPGTKKKKSIDSSLKHSN
jgi:hypothetical protein